MHLKRWTLEARAVVLFNHWQCGNMGRGRKREAKRRIRYTKYIINVDVTFHVHGRVFGREVAGEPTLMMSTTQAS